MDEFENKLKNVSQEIEKLKLENPGLNYIECTVEVCERYDIELEAVKKILNRSIKEKLEADAMKLNLLKNKNINTLI
jgi:hypothetical protein